MSVSTGQVNHLVKMANDIARNLACWGDEPTVARKVAQHMQNTWTVAMRTQLAAYWLGGGEGLHPAVASALALMEHKAQAEGES